MANVTPDGEVPALVADDRRIENDEKAEPRESAASGRERLPPASVIIPVRNDPVHLARCLTALGASDHPRLEIIVVDDGSTDDTPQVAVRHGARLIRMERHSGPAAARNAGARQALHPYLFFIDADVCVHPSTIRQGVEVLAGSPSIDALFGSYDQSPGARNVVSQYRNLLHHYVHQGANREAFTFWSGCGAIKRSVFLEVGGFNTGYEHASIEDIDLGARLRKAGRRVVLVKEIQAQHLKKWTLLGMIETDVLKRAIPWTLLLLREGHLPNDLNLKSSQRLSVLLTFGLTAMLLLGSWFYRSLLLLPLGVLLGVVLIDRWTQKRPVPALLRILIVLAGLSALAVMLWEIGPGANPIRPDPGRGGELLLLLTLASLLGIVLLNLRFYVFLAKVKDPLFLLPAVPLHILYFLYGGLAFVLAAGWYAIGGRHLGLGVRRNLRHLTEGRARRPQTREIVEQRLRQAFAHYDPVALGGAVAAVAAGGFFLATAVLLLRPEEVKGPTLSLLGQLLFGFEVSWGGSLIGLLEAGIGGFAFGYVLARMINLLVSTAEIALWHELDRIQGAEQADR